MAFFAFVLSRLKAKKLKVRSRVPLDMPTVRSRSVPYQRRRRQRHEMERVLPCLLACMRVLSTTAKDKGDRGRERVLRFQLFYFPFTLSRRLFLSLSVAYASRHRQYGSPVHIYRRQQGKSGRSAAERKRERERAEAERQRKGKERLFSPLLFLCLSLSHTHTAHTHIHTHTHALPLPTRQTRVGVELKNGGDIVDVTVTDPSIPAEMRALLNGGAATMDKVKA